jgi:hypothetical protein
VIGVPELSGRLDEETFEVPDVNWTHWSPQSIILLTELSKLSNHNNNNNNLVDIIRKVLCLTDVITRKRSSNKMAGTCGKDRKLTNTKRILFKYNLPVKSDPGRPKKRWEI